MDGNSTKLLEEKFQDVNNPVDEYMLDENLKQVGSDVKIPKKSILELSQEEETLKIHLDELKKENFTLQASIKAWQTTLKNKLDEFKQADLKLDEIYNEIWSEREKFCSRAGKFNDSYGVLSDWWATQLKFVSDLENLERKSLEDHKCRLEIEKLEKEVAELKKEIDVLQAGKQVAEVEVHATAEQEICWVRKEDSTENVSPNRSERKKVRFANMEDAIEVCHDRGPTKDDLYSIVDLEKLKVVNRNRNRLRKTRFFWKSKKASNDVDELNRSSP